MLHVHLLRFVSMKSDRIKIETQDTQTHTVVIPGLSHCLNDSMLQYICCTAMYAVPVESELIWTKKSFIVASVKCRRIRVRFDISSCPPFGERRHSGQVYSYESSQV